MPAYITVQFNPLDQEKLQQYGAAVPSTLAPYSGEYLTKGPVEQLSGSTGFQLQVILVFPSKALAVSWYHSDPYQTLVPLRDGAMSAKFQLMGD